MAEHSWKELRRYLLLAVPLFLLLAWHSWSDAWRGDFWIYVATVDELAARPWNPKNPLVPTGGPFAFVSPYMLALGLVSRWTGLGAFDVLVAQGLLNLLLLLGALFAFVVAWGGRRGAPFYALLFLLFLWGRGPWLYSGFFHLESLALVLPYPSTFAAALALAVLALHRPLAALGSRAWLAAALPAMTVLWITHPVNGLFLGLGLAVASLEAPRPRPQLLALAFASAASLGLALSWPFFPVADLWFGQAALVHEGNTAMYDAPITRIAPALLGVPWLALRLRRRPRDPLAVLGLLLGGLVVYGGFSGQWSYGRLLSHAVLVLHVALADAVATLEQRLSRRPLGAVLRPLPAAALATALIAASWAPVLRPMIGESGRGDLQWLQFLREHVGRDDVVMADLDDGWHVPGFSGKVVAYPMALPFTPDQAQRVRTVERFFDRDAQPDERLAAIQRHGVAFVLSAKDRRVEGRALTAELRPLGTTVYSSPEYELIRIEADGGLGTVASRDSEPGLRPAAPGRERGRGPGGNEP